MNKCPKCGSNNVVILDMVEDKCVYGCDECKYYKTFKGD